jgi:hypothetical protein
MANRARKTNHCGPKRGKGAFWGPKQEVKKMSNKMRRTCAALEKRIALIQQAQRLTANSKQVFKEVRKHG